MADGVLLSSVFSVGHSSKKTRQITKLPELKIKVLTSFLIQSQAVRKPIKKRVWKNQPIKPLELWHSFLHSAACDLQPSDWACVEEDALMHCGREDKQTLWCITEADKHTGKYKCGRRHLWTCQIKRTASCCVLHERSASYAIKCKYKHTHAPGWIHSCMSCSLAAVSRTAC